MVTTILILEILVFMWACFRLAQAQHSCGSEVFYDGSLHMWFSSVFNGRNLNFLAEMDTFEPSVSPSPPKLKRLTLYYLKYIKFIL